VLDKTTAAFFLDTSSQERLDNKVDDSWGPVWHEGVEKHGDGNRCTDLGVPQRLEPRVTLCLVAVR
jgi:hypothetical protein